MQDDKLPVGEVITFALRFGLRAALPLLRLGWLPLLVLIVGAGLTGSAFADAATLGALPSGGSLVVGVLGALIVLLGLVLLVPVYVVLVRWAAEPDYVLPGGALALRFGSRERKVLGAGLLLLAIFVLLILVLAVPIGLSLAGGAGPPGGGAIAFLVLAGIVFFALFVWLTYRLIVFVPLAATEDRVSLGEAFRTTKGHFWRLLGAGLVVGIITALIGAVDDVVQLALTTTLGLLGDAGALVGVVVAAIVTVLVQIYTNLVQIGFAGRVTGLLRGYREESVEEVFG